MVGIVVTISPNFNLYKMVVFPAASSPTEKNRTLSDKHCFHVLRPDIKTNKT